MVAGAAALRYLAALTLLAAAQAAAGQVYPVKPITLVVPFSAGGAADGVARLLAERLNGILQQPVRVENRPGAGFSRASQAVAQAEPDGYTLLYVTESTLVAWPVFARAPNYDPLASFTPISLLSWMPCVLAVNPAIQARDLDELVAALKGAPGRFRYATDGWGTMPFRAGELFKTETGVDIRELAAKTPLAAVESLARGNADLMFELSVFFLAPAREGRVRPLAIMGHARLPELPGVPTTAELGFPGMVAYYWTGVVGPAGMPRGIVEVLNRAVRDILAEIETQATFRRLRIVAESSTPGEFHRLIGAEFAKWSRVVPLSATAPR